MQTKRIVRVSGEVQFPIKIGEAAYYLHGKYLIWTDNVKKILEISSDHVRLETTSYYYIIEREKAEAGALKFAA